MRDYDISKEIKEDIRVIVDNVDVQAETGETVLSTLLANGFKAFSLNDHSKEQGAYCGMGVCHACMVTIDGNMKQRSCLIPVKEGMNIQTKSNLFTGIEGLNDE